MFNVTQFENHDLFVPYKEIYGSYNIYYEWQTNTCALLAVVVSILLGEIDLYMCHFSV